MHVDAHLLDLPEPVTVGSRPFAASTDVEGAGGFSLARERAVLCDVRKVVVQPQVYACRVFVLALEGEILPVVHLLQIVIALELVLVCRPIPVNGAFDRVDTPGVIAGSVIA